MKTYIKSSLDKAYVLKEIEKEKDYEKKCKLKTTNARTIDDVLAEDDLHYLPEIVHAIEKALTISLSRPLTAAQLSS